ncbi:MAG: radical SAM protein, partial [Deltaproteobacteria bacterium]
RSAGVASNKIAAHEDAAHEKRNWVRLTFDCNNRCTFCLDSDTHDGEIRNREEVKTQILDGRRGGAERLILSGGEPTIHPSFVDFIKLGRRAGYRWIQTVTNGRLFSYPGFLGKCLDAGLDEITFSVHGPNAKIHDALVGVKGAFDQEINGLQAALTDGRPVVNIDVVINRGNVKQLPKMLEMYTAMGVKEFDLLQVIPFGRAFTEGRETLFYDLEEMRPYLLEAFAYSKRPDLHVWLNRFPPQHLEGYEHLIQDPYKLNDEVRGRKEEYARLLGTGEPLDCREPHRCKYCYLEKFCDTLDAVRDTVAAQRFDVVRVDTEWEAQQAPVFGGDPASSRRARHEAAEARTDGRVGLSVVDSPALATVPTLLELVAAAGAKRLWVRAPDVLGALVQVRAFPTLGEVELELDRHDGLAAALATDGAFGGARLVSVRAGTVAQAESLLAIAGDFEVMVALTRETAPWLLAPERTATRLAVFQPTYERLTESAEHDVDLRDFFSRFALEVPVEGVPACSLGRSPRRRAATLDTTMLTPEGRIEIFRYARRYIVGHYLTKSLRCKTCVHSDVCDGMHVNYVRAHGYGLMQPVRADAE